MKRMTRLLNRMETAGIEQLYVVSEKNIRYLTGFTGDSSALLISPKRILLITDGRYIEQAQAEIDPAIELFRWQKGLVEDSAALINESGFDRVSFEEAHMTYGEGRYFIGLVKTQAEGLAGLVEEMRKIKDQEELGYIREAVKIVDKTFLHILNFIRPGVTEREVAAEMEYFMKKNGSEGTSFETIVASGIRSSYAHGEASDKVIALGETVTLDFGALVNGYASDMTRTIGVGSIHPKLEEFYTYVLEAEEQGLKGIRAGMKSWELDQMIRQGFKEKGVNQYFFHGAGHSIGLDIHEAPFISSQSEEPFAVNMVQTIEPGLYYPGLGGIRIEDDILVQEGQGIILTQSPKRELIKLPFYAS